MKSHGAKINYNIYFWGNCRKNLELSFVLIFNELWASKYDFWTQWVPKYMIHRLSIFGGKNLKSSFEHVCDELWPSKYDFWSQTVPKYNIIYVFEETVEKSLKSSFGQVSNELWACKYDFWTHWVPKYKIYVFEDIRRKKFKIKFWICFRWAMSF